MNQTSEKAGFALWQLLWSTYHLIGKARMKELSREGISPQSARILSSCLELGKDATPSALRRDLFVEPHTITVHLKKMEKSGLITKVRDLGKKNLIRIELTGKGHELYRKSSGRKSIGSIMSVLSPEEQIQFKLALLKLRDRAIEYLGLDSSYQTGVTETSTETDFALWQLLWSTYQVIIKARSKELTGAGISPRSAGILSSCIESGKNATPSTLRQELFVEPHSISGQLKRMERNGLINKVRDLGRQNLIRIELTEKGYELYRKSSRRKSINSIISVLNHEEQIQLKSSLSKLQDKSIEYVSLDSQYSQYQPGDTETPTESDFALWQLLWSTYHLIGKARTKELSREGISSQAARILSSCQELGKNSTPSSLSQELFLEPHTISGQLKRMEKNGLINKVKDLGRKNLIRIELTEKGYELYRKSSRRQSINSIMSSLSRKEQSQLEHPLLKLRDRAIEYLGLDFPHQTGGTETSERTGFYLWQLLWSTHHLIGKARAKELTGAGISLRSAGILSSCIELGKNATPSALRRDLFVEPHTISGQLKRMEKNGLIKKVKDLGRKNLIRIELTEAGYELYRKSSGRQSINSIMSVLSREEQIQLEHPLLKLQDRAIEYLGLDY